MTSEASVLSLLSPIIVDILLSAEFVWVVGVDCERVPEILVLVIHVDVFCVHFTALIKKMNYNMIELIVFFLNNV